MKKVSRKKGTPPVAAGRAEDCAPEQKRAASIEPPTAAANPRSREPMTLQEAVRAQKGVTVQPGSTDSDADGITPGGDGVGIVMVNMPFWQFEFAEPGKPEKEPLNTLMSALVALLGQTIGRTSDDHAAMTATLDRLREYLIPWALAGFKETGRGGCGHQPHTNRERLP